MIIYWLFTLSNELSYKLFVTSHLNPVDCGYSMYIVFSVTDWPILYIWLFCGS